jgi:hypothetical protein
MSSKEQMYNSIEELRMTLYPDSAFMLRLERNGAMLETCGSSGKGCTSPVTVSSLKQLPALARRPGRYNPMLTVVPGDGSGHEGGKKDGSSSLIDEIVREGARRMLAEALQAEVDAYIATHAAERDDNGRRLVVRNGYHQPREVLTSADAIEVTVPRVNDKRTAPVTGERKRFSSAIVPPWCRKTPKITEVLPLLYLHGLSSGDFVPAWASSPARRRGCRPR